MTNKALKLIYGYMDEWGWAYELIDCPIIHRDLDSNSAWEVVQEMERKGDVDKFMKFAGAVYSDSKTSIKYLTILLYNPTNFFNCFAKWLEEGERRKNKK